MANVKIKITIDQNRIAEVTATFARFKGGKAGFFGGQTYDNGLTVAGNAALQNFGNKHIPARPFMDNASTDFAASKPAVGKIYQAAIENNAPEQANARVGALFAQKIREAIRKGDFAPLSKQTIKRKGSSKPLIDSALMIQSVEFKEN